MKKSLNLLVLFSFLLTTMPVQTVFAVENQEVEDAVVEIPAEAVTISEQLVAENNEVKNENSSEEGPSCIKSGVAYSPRMTREQRKELFVHGQITDCEGNIWNIKVIPGSDVSKQMTIKSWRYAGDKSKQMFKIETYKKAARHGKEASRASFNFAKESSKLLKKGIWDYMIVEGVYNDLIVDNARVWKQAGATVAKLRGSFGWLFGAIYAGVLKPLTLTGFNIIKAAYHITAGTVILVGGVAGTAGGIIATVASPVIVPAVEVMTYPLLAVGSIFTTGSIIPGVIYVWNGTAWVSTQLSHVPDSETTIGGVRFVRLKNPKQPERPKVEITQTKLTEVVEASVKTSTKKTQIDELNAKRNEIQKQIEELQRQAYALSDEVQTLNRNLSNDPAVRAVADLIYSSYNSDMTISAEVQEAASSDEALRDLIQKYADENGLSLSEKEIENAVSEIKRVISRLNAK